LLLAEGELVDVHARRRRGSRDGDGEGGRRRGKREGPRRDGGGDDSDWEGKLAERKGIWGGGGGVRVGKGGREGGREGGGLGDRARGGRGGGRRKEGKGRGALVVHVVRRFRLLVDGEEEEGARRGEGVRRTSFTQPPTSVVPLFFLSSLLPSLLLSLRT